MRTIPILTILILLNFSQAVAQDTENAKHFDKYSVYYTVFNSTFVQADVAKQYKIKRSKYESLINVSVVRTGEYGGLPVKLSGTVTNLLQQQKKLVFQEIKEKDSVYYLAPLRINGEEVVHFNLSVQPKDNEKPLVLTFTKTLYSD